MAHFKHLLVKKRTPGRIRYQYHWGLLVVEILTLLSGATMRIIRVIEILNRQTKNNPVLIGEPGVGKTAVVEGLAQKIVDGDVPHKLQGENKSSVWMWLVLVQGTGYPWTIWRTHAKAHGRNSQTGDIILFIDEIHEIVGAGSAGDGNMDAGNILKPALARGELQLVGATTLNEYRIIEKMLP